MPSLWDVLSRGRDIKQPDPASAELYSRSPYSKGYGLLTPKDLETALEMITGLPLDKISMEKMIFDLNSADIVFSVITHNSTLTNVSVGENIFGAEECKLISNCLQQNEVLRRFRLDECQIDDSGVMYLAEGLTLNTTLTEISFNTNNIGDGGALQLSKVLDKNNTLKTLNLGKNLITNKGARSLADGLIVNKAVKSFSLNDNKIGTLGILALADTLQVRGQYDLSISGQKVQGESSKSYFHFDAILNVKLLGRGNFGTAYVGNTYPYMDNYRDTALCVAKVGAKEESSDSIYEALLLQMLPEHENLIKMYGVNTGFQSSEDIENLIRRTAVVLEFHPLGSLEKYLQVNIDELNDHQLRTMALGVSKAVQHLHQHDIIHRDLATRNCVINNNGQPVLIDFGLACLVGETGLSSPHINTPIVPTASAPEVFKQRKFSKQSDIWLLGIIFSELINAEYEIQKSIETQIKFIEETVDSESGIFSWISVSEDRVDAWQTLILMCCSEERLSRPDAALVIEMLESEDDSQCEGKSDVFQLKNGEEIGDMSGFYNRDSAKYFREDGREIEPDSEEKYFDERGQLEDVGIARALPGGYFDEREQPICDVQVSDEQDSGGI